MKKLIHILFCVLSFSTSAQTIYDLKEQYIIKLTKMVNPKKDSIRDIKLKAIRFIHFQNNKTDTLVSNLYDKRGNVLKDGTYSFKYDSSEKLTFIKFVPEDKSLAIHYDSIDLTKKLDTNKVLRALSRFNQVFYDNSMQEVYKRRKESNTYYDTLNFNDAHFNLYCQKRPEDTVCYINRIRFRSYPHLGDKNIIETVKYDYGYHPPSMEITKDDTLNKIKRIYCYYFPQSDENNLIYSYKLHTIYTTKYFKDHREEIMEDYVGNDDKIFEFPQSIEITKYYDNLYEYSKYKQTSSKKRKLIEYYTQANDKTYYK